MPARSIPWRPASWPSRWAKRPRPSPMPGRREDLSLHRDLGRKPRQRRCRRRGHRHLATSAPAAAEIEAMLPRFTGTLNQVPPAYSAIKVEGERAYDLAREGEEVVLEPRPVQVFEARLLARRAGPGASSKSFVAKALTSGPGSAISPWPWALWAMFRPCAGPGWAAWHEKDAVGLDTLTPFMHSPAAFAYLRPLSTALDGIPALAVTGPRYGSPPKRQPHPHPREFVRQDEGRISVTASSHGLTVFLKDEDGCARGIGRNRRRRASAVSCLQLFRTSG